MSATMTRRQSFTVHTLDCTQCPTGTYRTTGTIGTYRCGCGHEIQTAYDVRPYLAPGETLTLDRFGALAVSIPN